MSVASSLNYTITACAQRNDDGASFDGSLTTDMSSGVGGPSVQSPVVNHLSRCIMINSVNCALLAAETRCRRVMEQAAKRRRRLVAELAMRCPPLTVYGPASAASVPDLPDCDLALGYCCEFSPF